MYRMNRPDPDPAPRRARPAARATYRDLAARGLAPTEAGNVTAFMRGLRPAHQGWTVAEIDRLLFLRFLVERGRLDPSGAAVSAAADTAASPS